MPWARCRNWKVTWAWHQSRFTKKFEQQVACITVHQSKKLVCEQMRINWRTVGSIISRVQKAKEKDPKRSMKTLKPLALTRQAIRRVIPTLQRSWTTWPEKLSGSMKALEAVFLRNSLSKLVQKLLLKSRWSVVMVPDGLKIQSVNMPLRLFSALTHITLSRGLLMPWTWCAAASGEKPMK